MLTPWAIAWLWVRIDSTSYLSNFFEFLAATKAPWWWTGVLTLAGTLGGVVLAGRNGRRQAEEADRRRFDSEELRWQQTQEHERVQFYRAKLLDEAGELLAAAEVVRLRVLRIDRSQDFDADGEWIDTPKNVQAFRREMEGFSDDVHPLRVRIERMRMLGTDSVFAAVSELDEAFSGFAAVLQKGSKASRGKAQESFTNCIRNLEDAVSGAIHP